MEGWLDEQMDNSSKSKSGVVGRSLFLHVDDLLLDVENPRFGSKNKAETQEDIALKLEMGFDIITVAESIARNGFLTETVFTVSSIAKSWCEISSSVLLSASGTIAASFS